MEATMRRLLLSLALALTLSALGASPALAAGAQRVPMYGPISHFEECGGGVATPENFGFAVLNAAGNRTTLSGQIVVRGLKPSTVYEVVVWQEEPFLGGCANSGAFVVGTFTTNQVGNGNFRFTVARNPETFGFFVEVFGDRLHDLFSPAVELN
jgi:hypothetical protein